ncbi:hypothetical protein Hanom_Chr15g01381211 [Helianthus anomalus]
MSRTKMYKINAFCIKNTRDESPVCPRRVRLRTKLHVEYGHTEITCSFLNFEKSKFILEYLKCYMFLLVHSYTTLNLKLVSYFLSLCVYIAIIIETLLSHYLFY